MDHDFLVNKEKSDGFRIKKMKTSEQKRKQEEYRIKIIEEKNKLINDVSYRDAKLMEHTGLSVFKTYKAYFTDWWNNEQSLYDITIVDYIGLIRSIPTNTEEEYVRVKSSRFWGEMDIKIKDIVRPREFSEKELELIKEIDPYREEDWEY